MSKFDPDFERRLCRIDGLKPTARDRWRAFHRLWRIANGRSPERDLEAGTCFRVLFGNWRYVQLLDGPGNDGLVNRSHIPKFLRRQLLDHLRRKRLYGGRRLEWEARDKAVVNKLRQEGHEVLPIEVAEARRKVINIAKRVAAEKDYPLPDDDEAILDIILPRKGETYE